MPNELALKWLDALRSGSYQQTKGALRSVHSGFCCLGVLCDVMDSSKWVPPHPQDHRYVYVNADYNAEIDPEAWDSDYDDRVLGGYPPRSYLAKVGLTPNQARELAGMNDEGASFTTIADTIEDILAGEPDAG